MAGKVSRPVQHGTSGDDRDQSEDERPHGVQRLTVKECPAHDGSDEPGLERDKRGRRDAHKHQKGEEDTGAPTQMPQLRVDGALHDHNPGLDCMMPPSTNTVVAVMYVAPSPAR